MGKDQIKCNSNAVHFIRGIYKINKFIYYCYLMIYLWQFILKMSMFFYCQFVTSGGLLRKSN